MQVRIVSSGLNIITSMIDSHATNGWSNCGYANGFRFRSEHSLGPLIVSRYAGPDRIERIEHHHVDDRQPRHERLVELRIRERFRLDELQLDALLLERLFRI